MTTMDAPMLTSGASGRLSALILLFLRSFLSILLFPFRYSTIKPLASNGVKKESQSSKIVVKVPVQLAPVLQASARKQLAIKRVEMAMKEEKSVKREFELIETQRGETLFTQAWTPIGVKIKGLVVLMHGLNEHSGRYDHFARRLNRKGFKVCAMDWIGHGGSGGLHGYVHSLDHAVKDLKVYIDRVLNENPGLPCFLFGHSTGGAIILKALAPIFSLIAPRWQLSNAQKNGPQVSRDPEALRSKYSDPLVFTGSIRIRTGYEILRISTYLQTQLCNIKLPFLVLHGAADLVTDPNGSRRLYNEAGSEDKEIEVYKGLLHDLLIEPEKGEIIEDIVCWLELRV